MELYLLKIYKTVKKLQPEVCGHFPYLIASTITLFCLMLPISKSAITNIRSKYRPKPKNFMAVDSMKIQKPPFTGVLRKMCSENIQEIYRRITMPKCDFNKAAKQLY